MSRLGNAAACPFNPPLLFFSPALAASEITEIRNAVGGLKSALEAIKNNGDAASAPMLRLRLREARDQLQRRLLEVRPTALHHDGKEMFTPKVPGQAVGDPRTHVWGARTCRQVSPSTAPDPSLSAATREAGILLDEVNALFFPA